MDFSSLPIWRRVTLVRPYHFPKKHFRINPWARAMLRSSEEELKPREVDLVLLSGEQLGIENSLHYFDLRFWFTSKNTGITPPRGIDLCPLEVGFALRRQYIDQPEGEVLHIAMKPRPLPSVTKRNQHYYLTVSHDKLHPSEPNELWLRATRSDISLSPRSKIIFVRP